MTDRELLELAAMAAGLEVIVDARERGLWIFGFEDEWNPLADDGEALRLAITLGIQILPGENYVECVKVIRALKNCRFLEMHKDDPHAATRRAIVRAAAEIGKQRNSYD